MDASGDNAPVCMWRPDSGRVTNMDRFRARINENFNLNLSKFVDMLKSRHRLHSVFVFVNLNMHAHIPVLYFNVAALGSANI